MSSFVFETKRSLDISNPSFIEEDYQESVVLTLGNGESQECKIEFYNERWRSANEWRILLKGILAEIEELEKEGETQKVVLNKL